MKEWSSHFEPSDIIALAAFLVSIVTAVVEVVSLRSDRSATMLGLFADVRERMGSLIADMRTRAQENPDVFKESLLNEIEWLGFLTKRGAVPDDVVRTHYGEFVMEWVRRWKDFIRAERTDDATAYTHVLWLARKIDKTFTLD